MLRQRFINVLNFEVYIMPDKTRWIVGVNEAQTRCLGEKGWLVPLSEGGFIANEEDAKKEAQRRIDLIVFFLIPEDKELNMLCTNNHHYAFDPKYGENKCTIFY